MRYIMKSGSLSRENSQEILARIKSSLIGMSKQIYGSNGQLLLEANSRFSDPAVPHTGDIREREYVLTDSKKHLIAQAQPGYAKEDDPQEHGWPLCRLPKVDHAHIIMSENQYVLTMKNSQQYGASNINGTEVLSITHRSITGGWQIEDTGSFSPEVICGLFVFSRYIEQDNEFLTV